MPTVLNKNGFKFFFYANEHEPIHIHVTKGELYAKIEIPSLKVTQNHMKAHELKKALTIAKENVNLFIRSWNDYFKG